MTVTVSDMFCGAGGSSTGAVMAGAEVRLAMNHWARAIETHNMNHPLTDHALADISQANPCYYPRTDILIASPECTNHSLAKGRARKNQSQLALWNDTKQTDPSEERSRCTMWDPLRFAECHRYKIVILENVVDARYWVMWDAWMKAWDCLGYEHELVFLNSMFAHPTPQSRDRMYFVAWRSGQHKPDLDIRPEAECKSCGAIKAIQAWKPGRHAGKYRQQYVYACSGCAREVTPHYYPAASAIDWARPITRISERKTPLKEKTTQRIAEGLKKFAHDPFLMSLNHQRAQVSGVDVSWPTVTTFDDTALVSPPPFMIDHVAEYRLRSVNQPMSTVVGGGNHQSLVVPPAYLMSYYNNGSFEPVSQPVPTVTTLDRCALVTQETPKVEDCGFRMLEPQEIQAAMAFPETYTVTGTRREKVKQLGNAVTPPVMELLMRRCLAALA